MTHFLQICLYNISYCFFFNFNLLDYMGSHLINSSYLFSAIEMTEFFSLVLKVEHSSVMFVKEVCQKQIWQD